ncbi:M56 family metallopeptidase [Luteolibacter sp. SL250]|uniref:M56 family metallopeptidase n=1 Tax=Luteolibacter sp. SL250 TaxID=2995170 RepID=UPI002271D5A8|nr:M56 family metallopeptidase [Luteolibacter sp. SL250]WAC21893.1 M56 family metallopeptidase [Luteolibacter sp. SL250]
MSARWRYALWLPMLVVMVLPALPSVPFGWSLPVTEDRWEPVVATPPAAHEAVVEMELSPHSPAPAAVGGTAAVRRTVNPFAIAWLTGACVVLAMGLAGYVRHLRRISGTAVAVEESLLRQIRAAADEAGLSRVPRVLVSPMLDSPAVTGVFRATLLLPARFPEGFSSEETRLILLHEFCHLKRHDLAVNAVACVLQALHWFNPLLWFAFARMRADREEACDAQVLSIGSGDSRAAYGAALLKLQGGFPLQGFSLGFVGIFERAAGMKSRVREIAAYRKTGMGQRVAGAAMLTLLVVFGATKAQEPVKPETPAAGGGNTEKVAKPPSAGQIAIDRKLDTIVIPRISFQETALLDGVEFLRLRSDELDVTAPPAERGVNIVGVLRPQKEGELFNPGPRINLEKRNITLRDALVTFCQDTGSIFRVDDHAVVVHPTDMEGYGQMPEQKGAAADFAATLILQRARLEMTPLQELVDTFNEQAAKAAKGGPVFPIVIGEGVDPAVTSGTMALRRVPLATVLSYTLDGMGLTWTAEEKRIVIRKK